MISQKSTDIRNAALYMVGESLWCFQMYMVWPSTVLTMLLARYGAGKLMIGGMSAIEGGAIIVTQAVGVYLFHSRRHRKRQTLLYHFAVILPLMLLLALPAWPGLRVSNGTRCWLFLGCFAAMILSVGVIIPVWSDWIAHLFRQEIRGRVMGLSQSVAQFTGACGPLAAAWVTVR